LVAAITNGQNRASWERRQRDGAAPDLYAALDLGTNNCRLLVARPAEDGFRVVDAFSRIVRLGEGLAASGRLSSAAMDRTLEALRICAGKIRRRGVTELRAVATEACRRAANCEDFLDKVRRETGIELEIISQNEEAKLAICGCAPLIDPEIPDILLFDIGGGSTEICWLKASQAQATGRLPLSPAELSLHAWFSVPIGVITLAERYGGNEISEASYQAMVSEMAAAVADFDGRYRVTASVDGGRVQMLGTSGTVTTLAGVHKDLPRYDRAAVDGSYLDMETVWDVCDRITEMSYDERAAHPCIGPERADLVVAGCAILAAICRLWPAQRLRVADRGLREGMLYAMIHGVSAPDGRWSGEPGTA
jgi:exopolyphosphatase/guanosine-5'-triphosphate,3'-diphosphate pyrophosphatase